MKPTTQEWIDKAEGNFSSAYILLSQPKPNVDLVCFLSQQCIEMYLKACLQELGVFTPKTHVLPALLDLLLPTISDWESMRPELTSLSAYAVDFRYPGALATREMAVTALQDCTKVRKTIRQHIGLDNEDTVEAGEEE